jgi:pSer/pThr/pTyr-binding forkhead associated (FHA) protein
MSNTIERVIIRHLSGSKANQIEHLPVGDLREFAIGRDPSSMIAFDSIKDSVVSRRHAAIRLKGEGDRIAFELVDLDSSNGTFLNGERIEKEAELLPEDTIELGSKGPKFVFDVEPRPANFAARTRVIDIDASAATRVIETAAIAASTAVSSVATNATGSAGGSLQTSTSEPKPGVGKETVQRLIGEERRAASRTWVASIAGLAAFLVLGGGALLWKQWSDEERLRGQITDVKKGQDDASAGVGGAVKSLIGMTPQEIYNKFNNTTAQISREWRLIDKETGRPILHKVIRFKDQTLPVYVRLPGTNRPVFFM